MLEKEQERQQMLGTPDLGECYMDLLGDLFLVSTDREDNRPKEPSYSSRLLSQ